MKTITVRPMTDKELAECRQALVSIRWGTTDILYSLSHVGESLYRLYKGGQLMGEIFRVTRYSIRVRWTIQPEPVMKSYRREDFLIHQISYSAEIDQ